MKKNLIAVVTLAFLGLSLGGCAADKGAYSGNIKDDAVPVEDSSTQVASDTGSVTPNFSQPPKEIDDERSLPNSLLSERVIYFEYDKSIVPSDSLVIIDAHIDFLLRHPDKSLVLAGHTDERGSNEYNLALGQRRADAVRDVMLAAGVPSSQLESLSFGEESPVNRAANEVAWQENRRVELRYTDE